MKAILLLNIILCAFATCIDYQNVTNSSNEYPTTINCVHGHCENKTCICDKDYLTENSTSGIYCNATKNKKDEGISDESFFSFLLITLLLFGCIAAMFGGKGG